MKKICEKCKQEFECNHSEDCWCSKEALSGEVLKYLKENYPDCLCKTCLKEIIIKIDL
ncbi:MAG: cysteine-rich CWC family protein [Bacteroidales bacterium]|jgi:hypothetical protein|nr:cysteine-rich CWC family protein [Bacteroidales bacterium]